MATRREMLLRGGLIAAVTASLGSSPRAATRRQLPLPLNPLPLKARPRRNAPRRRARACASTSFAATRRRAPRATPSPRIPGTPPPPPPRPKLIAPEPESRTPPPPPVAPPLPFTFLGAFEAGGKRVLYIVEGDKVHAVSEGEVVNELYQVEAVGADEMVFTYLPLKLKQTLSLGNPK